MIVFTVPGSFSSQHLIEYDADTPNIRFTSKYVLFESLGRHIGGRTDRVLWIFIKVWFLDWEPKVCKLNKVFSNLIFAIFVFFKIDFFYFEEKVGRFDISMYYSSAIYLLVAFYNLQNYCYRNGLRECSFILDVFFEIWLTKLSDNANFVFDLIDI